MSGRVVCMQQSIDKKLTARLMPLYIAGFFQSFVLWYTIEKLFMSSIGFTNTTIGFMIAVYSAVMLIVETPSGILADRWSRKGVLIIASICIALSSLASGLSHGVGLYLVGAVFWGVFFACYTGMYESIIYDTLAEHEVTATHYDDYYGRLHIVDSLALVISSLAGGLLAATTDLRQPYFWSIPFVLIPVLALIRFREPTLHKQHVVIPIPQQVRDTFRAITRSRAAFPVVVVLVLRATLLYCVYEFAQLWLLALNTPTEYYGIANAVLLTSIGIGGIAASRLKLSQYKRTIVALVVLVAACIGLIVFRSPVAIVLSELVFTTILVSLEVIFSRILHDMLPASIRAGAASAASTIGRLVIIPVALVIGYLSDMFSIFHAAYLLLALVLVLTIFVQVVAQRNNFTGLQADTVDPNS